MALFCYIQVRAFENCIATTCTETYKSFMPCFVQHNMASTLTICFLRHCTRQRFLFQNLEGALALFIRLGNEVKEVTVIDS